MSLAVTWTTGVCIRLQRSGPPGNRAALLSQNKQESVVALNPNGSRWRQRSSGAGSARHGRHCPIRSPTRHFPDRRSCRRDAARPPRHQRRPDRNDPNAPNCARGYRFARDHCRRAAASPSHTKPMGAHRRGRYKRCAVDGSPIPPWWIRTRQAPQKVAAATRIRRPASIPSAALQSYGL